MQIPNYVFYGSTEQTDTDRENTGLLSIGMRKYLHRCLWEINLQGNHVPLLLLYIWSSQPLHWNTHRIDNNSNRWIIQPHWYLLPTDPKDWNDLDLLEYPYTLNACIYLQYMYQTQLLIDLHASNAFTTMDHIPNLSNPCNTCNCFSQYGSIKFVHRITKHLRFIYRTLNTWPFPNISKYIFSLYVCKSWYMILKSCKIYLFARKTTKKAYRT